MTTKPELFAAYGDDARAALDAWANLDPTAHGAWTAHAEERLYTQEYRRWLSRQTRRVPASLARSAEPLPMEVGSARVPMVDVRASVIHDGEVLNVEALTGHEGARMLREIALRDTKPARTTLARCKRLIALADALDAETDRLGRPVAVAEVVALAGAA